MYNKLLIKTDNINEAVDNIMRDYPRAVYFSQGIPEGGYRDWTIILPRVEEKNSRSLIHFLQNNENNRIFLLTSNPEVVDYRIKNLCDL